MLTNCEATCDVNRIPNEPTPANNSNSAHPPYPASYRFHFPEHTDVAEKQEEDHAAWGRNQRHCCYRLPELAL